MGCFDGRCAITRLPIRYGMVVYAIVLSPDRHVRTTYDLSNRLYAEEMRKEIISEFDDVMSARTTTRTPVISWQGYAQYNDYGWVEGGEAPERRGDTPIIIILADVAKEIHEYINKDTVMDSIMTLCAYTRINLFEHEYGPQHASSGEYDKHSFVAEMTIRLAREGKKWYDEEE